MAIEWLNIQNEAGGTSGTTLTHASYVVPSGTGKKLIVCAGAENTSHALTSGVTFDGNAMDLVISKVTDNTRQSEEMYEYDLGSSTPTGDIVITWSSSGQLKYLRAYVVTEIKQQAAEATAFDIQDSASAVSTTITTLTANAAICSSFSWGSSDTMSITGTGHIQDFSGTGPSSGVYGFGHLAPTTATGYTLGWSSSTGSSRGALVVAAFEAAVGGTVFNQAVSGSMTPAGSLTTQLLVSSALSGSMTPTGSISKVVSKTLTGSVTPSGTLIKLITKVLDGSMTPSGTIATSLIIFVSLSGQIVMTGLLTTLFIPFVKITNVFRDVFSSIFTNNFTDPDD